MASFVTYHLKKKGLKIGGRVKSLKGSVLLIKIKDKRTGKEHFLTFNFLH